MSIVFVTGGLRDYTFIRRRTVHVRVWAYNIIDDNRRRQRRHQLCVFSYDERNFPVPDATQQLRGRGYHRHTNCGHWPFCVRRRRSAISIFRHQDRIGAIGTAGEKRFHSLAFTALPLNTSHQLVTKRTVKKRRVFTRDRSFQVAFSSHTARNKIQRGRARAFTEKACKVFFFFFNGQYDTRIENVVQSETPWIRLGPGPEFQTKALARKVNRIRNEKPKGLFRSKSKRV